MVKKVFFLLLCYFYASQSNACSVASPSNAGNPINAPIFAFSNIGSFKSNSQNQVVTATYTPTRYNHIVGNCSKANLKFTVGKLNLDQSDVIVLNSRRYYRIKTVATPQAKNPAQIYIAFSVGYGLSPEWFDANIPEFYLYLSIAVPDIGVGVGRPSVLIKGVNLTPGNYSLSNIILGTFTFESPTSGTATQNLTISNLSYSITASTCVLNNPVVKLPTMRASAFSATQQIGGTTNFSITANCPNDADATIYSASISDNFTTATNKNGLLVNAIKPSAGGSSVQVRLTDADATPIPIGPLSLDNRFSFGSLNSNKNVSKTFNASYFFNYPNTPTVTAGQVQSVATINFIYE